VKVFRAQNEVGDIATDYIPTTTTAVSVGPVNNLPRLNYPINADGSVGCPSLLLEPQRTNVALYSEQFDNAYWSKDPSASVVANAAISPDGYQNADRLNFAASGNAVYRSGLSLSGAHRFSVYLKAEGANIGKQVYLEVAGGTSINVTLTGEWQRFTAVADNAISVAIKQLNSTQANSVLAWGAQVEAGAYATSYIPTLATSVTRVADLCNKTSVSSLIGQTEGTIFAEVSFDDIGAGGSSSYIYITDGSFANSVIVGREPASPNSKFIFFIQASSVNILNNTTNNITSGVVKMAVAYKSGDWAAYLNGNLVASGSSTFTFNASMNRFAIGPNNGAQTIVGSSTRAAQALLFKTRLTNAQMQELTSL
jgi:hypothetical protein